MNLPEDDFGQLAAAVKANASCLAGDRSSPWRRRVPWFWRLLDAGRGPLMMVGDIIDGHGELGLSAREEPCRGFRTASDASRPLLGRKARGVLTGNSAPRRIG
jgi:hypothetical protein